MNAPLVCLLPSREQRRIAIGRADRGLMSAVGGNALAAINPRQPDDGWKSVRHANGESKRARRACKLMGDYCLLYDGSPAERKHHYALPEIADSKC